VTEGITRHWWWRPGWRPGSRFYTFHFTFAAQPDVQELAARARERLAAFAWLDPVPGEWLHCTTQGVGFAGDVSETDLSAIASAARGRLAAVAAAAVTITAPHAASEGALCDVVPGGGSLDRARDAARAAIADVWGADRVPEALEWTPHVSVAYANAGGPAAPVDAALAGIQPAAAILPALDLIRLGRDRHVYEWETIESIPLVG
jgi:2'-5' RNA ligase